ncbi:hypothetical protein CBOM_05341 [Ceraceosorus bombacis]|uniref:Uncharacterized protein n=1 Tax=Ceraceosorus bombacis TaxID=401625 RepID=A0A0N7LB77_9BASI|nr:hypothetical protein CBOM_05341 [Ceraceosorus bombacis]
MALPRHDLHLALNFMRQRYRPPLALSLAEHMDDQSMSHSARAAHLLSVKSVPGVELD